MFKRLWSEGKIGSLLLRNRIVMEPMGHYYADYDGNATDRVINFYGARAKGGVGLIITEVVRVNDEHGRADGGQLSLAKDERIASFKKLADEIHQYGSAIFVQLHHPGRQGFSALNGNEPMRSASDVECQAVHQPVRPMTIEEIKSLVKDFAAAAARAKASGIDGVELHCAHGYLLQQFISPYTNKRTDEYGGSLENRLRIVREIIEAIRAECGYDYPLIARVSVDEFLRINGIDGGIKYEDGLKICKLLEIYGLDALDISAGLYETMNVSWEPAGYEQGWKAYLAKGVKEIVNIPVFCTAVIRDPDYAEKLLEEGYCDFVGSARQHLADPEWGNKARDGRVNEIRKCISCLTCMETLFSADATGIAVHCAVNAQAGMEAEYATFKEDGKGRTVVIIGAGPAGLEAARVFALRNFSPVIFEKNAYIGGQLEYANKSPKKDKINWLIDYYKVQCELHGIEVRLGTPATVGAIKALEPVAVFAACGSSPVLPKSIEGFDGPNVLTPPEILSGTVKLKNMDVCVIGSGATGLETADLLASQGNRIKLFELVDEIGPGLFFQNLIDVMSRLMPAGTQTFAGHKLLKIGENSAEFAKLQDGSRVTYDFDKLVISIGNNPNPVSEEILAAYPDIVRLGDCQKTGRIRSAVESGFKAAFEF